MKTPVIVLTLFLFLNLSLSCQTLLEISGGARSLAMGGTGTTAEGVHSLFTNPAGSVLAENFSWSLNAYQHFSIIEIRHVQAGALWPLGDKEAVSASLEHLGWQGYGEQKVGLAYGRRLFGDLTVGLRLVALHLHVPEYSRKTLITGEWGLQAGLGKDLSLGVHIVNPFRTQWAGGERLPVVFALGAAYSPSSKTTIHWEVVKTLQQGVGLRSGIEYFLSERCFIQLGASYHPSLFAFGAGIRLRNGMVLNMASGYHFLLGLTPSVGIWSEKTH